jgi:acetyl-CoA carboxylase biotin carboxyl carrier protein
MDLDLVREIVRLVEEANISELEVVEEGLRVVVKKQPIAPIVDTIRNPAPTVPVPLQERTAPEPRLSPNVHVITSPMVGTFYRAAAPDAEAFVEVGSTIDEETVVCILEAMKVMNELKAGVRGQVAAILVENGHPVEYGQPLFHVQKP